MISVLLALHVCTAANVCKDIEPLDKPTSYFGCLGYDGQHIAADWQREHPAFIVRGYSCSWGSRERGA